MVTRFIAIDVGQGDAFYLERGGFSVLVDGGKARIGFAEHFRRVTERDGVDVLVATHNDADHVNGLIGFLEAGLRCSEVWLPALWGLEDLIARPIEFSDELVADISALHIPEVGERLSLQMLGDRISAEKGAKNDMTDEGKDTSSEPIVDTVEWLARAVDAAEEWDDVERWWVVRYGLPWRIPYYFLGDAKKAHLAFEALHAAQHIRELVCLALNRGLRIRWFEYGKSVRPIGGIEDYLEPVNCTEVVPVARRQFRDQLSALYLLALTTSNRESLVFVSPPGDDTPGVLFTADSDLSFSQTIPWADGMVITAPHHGAEANMSAYERFDRECPCMTPIWVRSDGRFWKRPGPSYLNVRGIKFCTICRSPGFQKQPVRLIGMSGRWQAFVHVQRCCCC